MALFGIGKKNTKKEKNAPQGAGKLADMVKTLSSEPKRVAKLPVALGVKDVLLRPRVTEKAANLTASNVYTFDIRVGATKQEVRDAVTKLYKVTPVKIRVVNTPAKRVVMRRRRGFGKTAETRKAYVFLKKGEEISFT